MFANNQILYLQTLLLEIQQDNKFINKKNSKGKPL
jgi:hypothetical protein